jgi:hypothetical protein
LDKMLKDLFSTKDQMPVAVSILGLPLWLCNILSL